MFLNLEIVFQVNINFDKKVYDHRLLFEKWRFDLLKIYKFLSQEVCILLDFLSCLWLFDCMQIFGDLKEIIMLVKHLQWRNHLDNNYRNNTSKIGRCKHEYLFQEVESQENMEDDYPVQNFLFMLINKCVKHKMDRVTNY